MTNVELELAIQIMDDSVNKIEDLEEINVEDARNRILGEDIYAPINQPPFDRSPLDGYALRAVDTTNASKETPVKLKVVDEVFAGGYTDREIKENEAIRIMTGAKLPKGAICVIKQENTDYGMDEVEIYEQLKEYDNYCFAGEDIKKGSKLINAGEKLSYIHIGILGIMGFTKIKVKRKPKVVLFNTGDEIMYAGKPLKEGKIYDSNRMIICARLLDYGCDVIDARVLGDDEYLVTKEIENSIDKADLIITTGGVSVGKKDIMHQVIKLLGANRVFWKVKMKPGTPAIYAMYKDKPLLCLSGNPFAAIATFELMGKSIIYKLSGDETLKSVRKSAIMDDEFKKSSKSRRLIRGIYNDGKVKIPNGGHSSGSIASMLGCNCFVDIKAGTPKLDIGDKVDIIFL